MLLEILRRSHDDPDPDSDDGSLFWLVVADQFERKGIACAEAISVALRIIDSGAENDRCNADGADQKFIAARKKVLLELAARLRHPRPTKPPKKMGKPPALVLATGQIYAFPMMSGRAWHPYRLESEGVFQPDGWGALVVLSTGRVFDWLPWVAIASLTGNPDVKPTFRDAVQGRLIPHFQTQGAGRYVPKAVHAKGLGLELLGTVDIVPHLVEPHLSKWSADTAVQFDWSIAYGALSPNICGGTNEAHVVLSSLLASSR